MTQNFYEDCLSEDLQASVSSQLKLLTSEQLTLNAEVAILRERCKDTTREWSKARQAVIVVQKQFSDNPGSQHLEDLLRTANAHLHSVGEKMSLAMKNQKEIVLAAVVADTKTRETLTENTLMILMNAVLDLVTTYYNDGTQGDIEKYSLFSEELRSRVVFQEADDQSIAVEYEFGAMLETVPKGPEPAVAGLPEPLQPASLQETEN